MINITIENEAFNANQYECSPTLVNVGDSVQTLDGVNHIENRKIKRSIKATFIDMKRADLYRLLQVCLKPYLTVTYFDTLSNQEETRIFILQNNPSSKIKIWKSHLQYYEGTVLELLEKGAE